MNYLLLVEWSDTDTYSTFFFDIFEEAIKERDRMRGEGNFANVYEKKNNLKGSTKK